MPAGEDQRMRLKENDAWFLELITQSILGRKMFCSPVRCTWPSMLLRPAKSVFQRPLGPATNASFATVFPPGRTWLARKPTCEVAVHRLPLNGAVPMQDGWAKNALGLLATATAGKLR